MSKLFILYLIFPVIMIILYFFSKDYKLPEQIEDTGISRVFLKISLFIYSKARKRTKSFSSDKVRLYLKTLEQKKDLKSAETEYFIRKISIVLLMATAGSFLSFMMSLSSSNSGHIKEGGVIERNAFGGREFDTHLVASDEEGNEMGEYDLNVRTRSFTKEEANALFEELSDGMERMILAENESLDDVESDLNLPEKVEGYPFDIRWRVDNYEVMHFDGKLIEEMIPDDGVVIMLSAEYTYGTDKWQQIFSANLRPKELDPFQKLIKGITGLIREADDKSLESDKIYLPDEYEGTKIVWSEKITDNSILLLVLTLIGGAASYVLKDKELKGAMESRNVQMLKDYPQFVSQLVLYMGAGMSMRNILARLSSIYVRERKKGKEKRYLYEEILRTNREIAAGNSEAGAYEQLGIRCSSQQYTRLATLLSQNLRKGNSELLQLLREESKKAFDERMDKVRKAGEEAGTKLLLPMIIMLVIVMVIIMIPAYMAF